MQEELKRMKLGTEHMDFRISDIPNFNPDENEVCEVLLHLPRLISESESRQKFSVSWGSKKRRSSMNSTPLPVNPVILSSSSPQFLHKTAAQGPPYPCPRPTDMDKADVSSPSTPLSFSPSESDEKPERSNSKCPNEEWLEVVDRFTQSRGFLKTTSFGLRLEETHLEFGSLNISSAEPNPASSESPITNLHQSPLTNDQTSQILKTRENYEYPCSQKVSTTRFMDVSPLGIPDLNVSAEEAVWMDGCEAFEEVGLASSSKQTSKAMAAEARRRRMQICKMKNNIIASKIRYSCR